MAPMGTEMLMHLKPVQHHSWGYHALKAWYIGPARKHYRVLKGVTDSGAVRLNDTWKFKHHSLTIPTITATDRIVKATQDLTAAIGGRNNSPWDKLEAIEDLRVLIYGSSAATPPPAPAPVAPARPLSYPTEKRRQGTADNPITPPFQFKEEIIPLQNIKDNDPLDNLPVMAHDMDDKLVIPGYNLRSLSKAAHTAINTAESTNEVKPTLGDDIGYVNHRLIPGIKIQRITRRYANGLAAANHDLQICQLQRSLKENIPK